ncbi:MAG TPA: DUF4097 family beta strand repeat-containing protein [Candidatus Angelobacter sp.]|nr:DUF4097 family beta strand repeat-containing protein [Candidatus Angelobacter sp.]
MAAFTRTQEVDHAIGPTGRFVLRVTSSDVELRAAPGDRARVRIEFDIRAADDAEADEAYDRAAFRVSTGDGLLEISEPKRIETGLGAIARLLGGTGGRVETRIVAELPPGARVSCTGVSAELTVSGLIGTQEYKTVSGDAVLNDAAGRLRITSVSGDLSLRGVGPIALEANSVSGDIAAFAPRLERTRVVTVSGDIEIEGELNDREHHRFETVSGDLSLGAVHGMTLEVRGLSTDVDVALPHRSEGSRDRRRYVIGQDGPTVTFSSMSGDVSVRPARRYESRLEAPRPPHPPAPPAPLVDEAEQLAILRALEAGEIDVEEAGRRLAGERSDG